MRQAALLWIAFSAVVATAGDLHMRFVLDGPVPPQPLFNINGGVAFCGGVKIPDERLLIEPKSGGIANVVVYVYTGRGGSQLEPVAHEPSVVTMANQACRFQPRIVALHTGDTLKVTNPDPVGHNCNISFFKNDAINFILPANQFKDLLVEHAEPAPIPVDCNIHPWMKGYVIVLDHPFVGISDTDGDLVIKNLPNQELTFRVYVEAASGALDQVIVDEQPARWARNRFSLTIKEGVNDMGTVKLAPAQLGL